MKKKVKSPCLAGRQEKAEAGNWKIEDRSWKLEAGGFWLLASGFWLLVSGFCFAQEPKEPVTVNGDVVEYSTDNREVTASGNVVITYKDATLTCDKITVDTQTKDGQASGNVRLEDKKGIIEGENIKYNFQTKKGIIHNARYRAVPFFGESEKLEKIDENEFIAYKGYMTTCSYDNPHYRIKAKKINFFPEDKVRVKNVVISAGQKRQIPLLYLPWFNKSLKDNFFHVQLMPGKSKDWGEYMLSAWRYAITENIKGRVLLDYRSRRGIAEGFYTNYTTSLFDTGDFKYYYTQERARNFPEGSPAEFQRYFIRWRHKWDIDDKTSLITQYYRITDAKRMVLGSEYNILKDYFPREYDKDSQPLTYAQFHHSFNYASFDAISQKRTNRWYTQLEKLPEIKYSLPAIQVGKTPLFFENASSFANFSYKHAVPSSSRDDVKVCRTDTYNELSLPQKVFFINLTPFAAGRQTYYNQDIYATSVHPRTVFYTGADLSTKFYRLFDIKTNFLGLDINRLRHIITPTAGYSYNHQPTVSSTRLKQIDSIDSIGKDNSVTLGLNNKLQTKRKDSSVDVVDFRIDTKYIIYTQDSSGNSDTHSKWTDYELNLDLIPYSWMRLHSDATYDRYKYCFKDVNSDVNFSFDKGSIGLGNRYERKGAKELTFNTEWRLNPKWKIKVYERYQFSHLSSGSNAVSGLKEQQYVLSRDLHCWTMEFSYNVEREKGESVWFVLRLKAFPELEFNFDKDYHQPKPGSQSSIK